MKFEFEYDKPVTTAMIWWDKDNREVTPDLVGQSLCADGDVFDKKKGRVVAISRAIEELPREKRMQVWEALWGLGVRKPC